MFWIAFVYGHEPSLGRFTGRNALAAGATQPSIPEFVRLAIAENSLRGSSSQIVIVDAIFEYLPLAKIEHMYYIGCRTCIDLPLAVSPTAPPRNLPPYDKGRAWTTRPSSPPILF